MLTIIVRTTLASILLPPSRQRSRECRRLKGGGGKLWHREQKIRLENILDTQEFIKAYLVRNEEVNKTG